MSAVLRSPARRLPRVPRLRLPHALAAALCLLGLGGTAPAGAAKPGPAIVLAGRVTQSDGAPIRRARVTLRAERARTTACDDSGRFRATLALPTVAALEGGPWTAQLDGAARGWRLVHADGEPSLGIELALERIGGSARVVARSNDERFAALAAAAVAGGGTRTLEGLRFVGEGGERTSDPPAPALAHVAAVTLAGGEDSAAGIPAPPSAPAVAPAAPAPAAVAPAAPAPAPPADSLRRASAARAAEARRVSAARADSVRRADAARAEEARRSGAARADSLRRAAAPRANAPRAADPIERRASGRDDSPVHGVDPDPPMGPATPPVVPRSEAAAPDPPGPIVNPKRDGPPPDASGCSCRFDGTVELVSSAILPAPERVVIRLEDWPAVADTVELYMGAPRGFRLAPVPCGSRRVTVARLAADLPPARIVTGMPMRGLGCASGELVQPRIVIALDRARRRR